MKKIIAILAFSFSIHWVSGQVESSIAFETSNGCLQYVADEEGNYIPDYSYAGYKNGQEAIPVLPVVKTISPIAGDNTAHIQAALDEVADMPLDEKGFRGTLLLEAGEYEVRSSITVHESGIVLRGVGQGSDPVNNTIIRGTRTSEGNVVQVGFTRGVDNSWYTKLFGSVTTVTNTFVPAGSRTLEVEAPGLYQVGDNVIIHHPSTAQWLESVNFGDTDTDDPWIVGELDMLFNRVITAIDMDEKKITLDVPIYDHLDSELATTVVYKYNRSGIRTNLGVENLRVVVQTGGEEDEGHAFNAIRLRGVEDAWVKDITTLHFVYAGVDIRTSNRVTVVGCTAIEPHSQITGGRRYNFTVARLTNNILFRDCHAGNGRHSFVSNGANEAAGIVFYNCTSDNDLGTTEGHRRWTQGMLYDNIIFTNPRVSRLVGLYNRGSFGTGHGWSVTNSTVWNLKMPANSGYMIQKPPHRQNFAIGCQGNPDIEPPFPDLPDGFVELPNQTPAIPSLYQAQLNFRMNNTLPPDAPARLMAQVEGETKIVLNWLDIATGESGYRVEIQRGVNNDFELLTTLDPNVTTYTHDISDATTSSVTYRVSAVGATCYSPYSNSVNVRTGVVTSLNPEVVSSGPYPNPFEDVLNIGNHELVKEIFIHSANGKIMPINWDSANAVHSSSWPAGIYMVRVVDQFGNTELHKVVKK